MARIKKVNRDRCLNDPLMPPYSDSMTHVCLTHTHWTHACKLAKEGYRTIRNEGKTKIQWDTEEAQTIFSLGVMVNEYSEELWDDEQAMMHFMAEDNLNASVGLSQDEMTMYGKLDRLQEGSAGSEPDGQNQEQKLLGLVMKEGQDNFSTEQIIELIRFRVKIHANLSTAFRECVFHLVGGQVRVNTKDFALVATLDIRFPWVKICILLQHYVVAMNQFGGV